jgi:hypothetical protein
MPISRDKKHIKIEGYVNVLSYHPKKGRGGDNEIVERNRSIHGSRILEEISRIKQQFDTNKEIRLPEGIVRDDAIYVEFTSEWGYPLNFDSLEHDNLKPTHQILNIKAESRLAESGEEYRYKVVVMMTEGWVSKFIGKVEAYLQENFIKTDKITKQKIDTGNPKNQRLINNIQTIQLATLESFWTDSPEIPFPSISENIWWEVWFRKTGNDDAKVSRILQNLRTVGAQIGEAELEFAEHRVRLVKGTALQLSQSLILLDNLAELRQPQEIADFITHKDATYEDQREWLDNLISRVDFRPSEGNVIVCILDSGVNNKHPLIEPMLPDSSMYSYKEDWGTFDSHQPGGHGTGVACLSIYGDLVDVLASSHSVRVYHSLESFKILHSSDSNDPKLYGAITEYATSSPIVDRSNPRVYCLTITDKNFSFKGRPSAWSAAIDKITFGSSSESQLFIVSGGNVKIDKPEDYPEVNRKESIHDPGQSYNAITVGAYTRKDRIDSSSGYSPLARSGEMSPSNSTSLNWDRQWPIKPDIVMEGGNLSANGVFTSDHSSLKLLTADKDYPHDIFLPFGDTSGAAALAAKMAAELRTTYPEYWPETIRALMIHSAEWTSGMLFNRGIRELNEDERINLLRSVGYGVPVLDVAMRSANNSLTLIAERTIQPYKKDGSVRKYNEYHLFNLPWPTDILSDVLSDQDVTLKITLSYFIEPNPGCRRYASNFHYHSHALDFAVIKPTENIETFQRRISVEQESGDEIVDNSGEEWTIRRVRSRGSVKKDFVTMSGADMSECNVIAVYPKNGWYKTRKKLDKVESSVRYSLVVTIESPDVEVDLYTPVFIQIDLPIVL